MRVRVRLSKIEVWCASVESFGLFIMLLTWRWRSTLRRRQRRSSGTMTGSSGRRSSAVTAASAAVAAAAVMAASAAVAAPRNALLPPTLPSTPLPPMLVVVVMGVTYAEGIKCCSELESLASLTTTIITTTFTY